MATLAADDGTRPIDIDPLDVTRPELYRDRRWVEPFEQLRAEAPVHLCENSRFGPYWSVSTYDPIVEIEGRTDIFSSAWDIGGITVAGDPSALREGELRTPMFLAMDPPKHTAQRRTVAPAFTPSAVERMRLDAVERTAALLDTLPVGQVFDWVKTVSIELTTGMLARMFDFPWDERHDLTRWSDALGDVELFHSFETRQYRTIQAMEMAGAFHALWARKAKEPPCGDLISMMLHSDAMAGMEETEFMGNLILLIVGGNDTTRNTMSALAYGLDLHPDERAKLEADPALAANATSEIIRWQTPLSHMRRTAMADAEVAGRTIRQGDKVVLWYLSANRDETVFPDGDRIIVDRPNARRHLSFGTGIHRCVGARVAEMQVIVLIEELAKRRLRVNVAGDPERVAGCFVNGYRSLPVQLSRY